MSKVSVIIPCFNQEKYISECLDAVEKQTLQDMEIIIINDGSTDKSLDIIKKYAKQDSRIKVINQPNKGVVYARNTAIKLAQSPYIFPLDADDIIANNYLELAYGAMTSGLGDIITSRVELFGHETGEMKLKAPTKYNLARENCLVNCALFRKDDFLKCGGYDNAFFHGLEDYDLWLNMVFRHNLKIYRIPEILFYYRIKSDKESRNKIQAQRYFLNLKQQIKKKYPILRIYKIIRKLQKIKNAFLPNTLRRKDANA